MNPSIHQDNVLTVVYAVHDFQAENPDELSFSAGEAIQVTEKDDQYGDGWWQGRNLKGDFGLFPQAYTVSVLPNLKSQPNSAVTSSPPQLIMNETLSQVQNAIDQLHLPSPTTNSFPSHSSHPTNSNSSSRSPSKSNQFQPSEDEDEITSPSIKSPTDWNLSNTNPTQARALLAQKAKTQSQNQSKVMQKLQSVSDQPLHLRASISTQDFDEIELSEESDDEDQNQFLPSSFNSLTNHQSIKSRGRSQSTHINLHQSNSHSNLHPSQNSLDPSKLIQPTQLSRRSSDISSISSFKSGPFSAAAFALGLTDPSKPKISPPSNQTNHEFQKSHQANKLSSSSLLSDTGVDPRDHSTPLATVLRMSRELTQTNQSEPSINSNPIKTSSSFKPIKSDETLSIWKSHQSDPHLTSPQENLYQTVISLNNQSDPIIKTTNLSNHQRQTSAPIVETGVFLRQQLTSPINPPQSFVLPLPAPMTSSSTTDSSSNKGSQSRSSSRIEPHLSNEELLISPATSTFPPPSGNKTGHNSLSSSQGRLAKSARFDIKSSTQPNQWTVTEVVEWGKLRGLDDFTLEKFVEHEITGDVLLELDVNSLKEIDLSAFGRRVRVMKAIEELKKISQTHHQPHPAISPFFDQNQSSSSPDPAGSAHSHQIPSRNEVDGPLTVNQNSNSSFTRPDHSNLKYQHQSYYPTPDTKLDAGEEELAPHLSQNPLVSKQSSIQLHQKRPSDPLVGVSKETSNPQHDETQPDLKLLEGIRLSSSGAHARQITFSHTEASKADQTRYRSKSSSDAFQIGHRSSHDSWSPISKPFIGSRAEDPAERAIESLNPTVSIDVDLNKSTKRGKKSKHLGGSKSVGTETMMLGKKSLPVDPSLSPPIGDRPSDMGSGKSRSSFLGTLRGRKPPPKLSSQMLTNQGNGLLTSHAEAEVRPSSSSGVNGRSSRGLFHFGSDKLPAQPQHQLHHLSPLLESKSLSSMIESENKRPELTDTNTKQGETRSALERIGHPDHIGWMRKKDDKYLTWKLRYFILKGANLYYLKGPTEIRIKGLIKLSGFKVVMDSDVNPGRYGFRIIHDNNTTHSFSADDPKVLRDWMKAMMKATIQRDWTAPVTSSCNIRTISIREAQKMFPPPRPPSPLSSIRLQKARLAANPDLLTDKDAAVLMSIQKFQSAGPGLMSPPESPIPSISVKVESRPLKTNQFQPSNQSVITSPSTLGFGPKNQLNDEQLLDWINNQLPKDCPTKATDFLQSIKNGMIIVRLVENLTGVQSGLSDNRFLANNDIKTDNKKLFEDEEFELYFCVFDYLNNQNIPLEGYSLNDMISGNSIKTKEFLLRIYGKFDKVK